MLTLLCAVGAWADVSELKVSDGSNTHYYLIKSYRSGKFAKWAGDNAQLLQSSYLTDANLWYVTADGDGYKLCNKATTNKYATISSFTAEGATVYIAENKHNSGYWCVSLKADQSANCWDDQSGKIGNYQPSGSDYEGTSWTFEEITEDINKKNLSILVEAAASAIGNNPGFYPQSAYETANAVYTNASSTSADYQNAFNTLAEAQVLPVSGKYYTITSAFSGFMSNQGVTKSVYVDGGKLKWKTTNLADPTMYWEIYVEGSKYVFKNYSTGTFISGYAKDQYSVGETAAASAGFTWLDGGQCNIGIAGGNFHTAGHSGGTGGSGNVIKYGSGKDNASSWYIIEVDNPSYGIDKAALANRLNELKNGKQLGINPGQYTLSGMTSDAYSSARATAETVLNGGSTTASDYENALATLNTAVASAAFTKNAMEVGKYYRIQSTTRETYTGVQCNDAKTGTSKMWNYDYNENDPGQIWKLEQDGDNYYLVNVLSGLYPQYVNGGSTATTYLGAKNADYKFTHDIFSEASSTAYPIHRIYFGGRQVNIETAGYVNYWTAENARHYIWTEDKTEGQILALAKNWVTSQNLTANAGASKITVTPGVTQVISPSEFAAPEVVNAAIDALKAYTSAQTPTLEQAQAVWNNASIVNTYKTNADNNGGLLSVEYTLKAKYGTIILPINYSKPTNVKLYSCENAVGSVLELTEYTGETPKNTPFIIEYTDEESLPTAESPKKYQFIGYNNGAASEDKTAGWLTGVLSGESATVAAGNYVLSKYNGKLGFYKVGVGATVDCPKYKCYLSNLASARAFYFDDEDVETGINAVEIEEVVPADAAIYDLSGRRVQSAKSGLYIVNGKKIIK